MNVVEAAMQTRCTSMNVVEAARCTSMNVVEAATQTEPTNSKTQGTRTQTDKVQDKRPLQKETALNVDVQPTTTQERPNKISEYIKNNNIEELYKQYGKTRK